MDYVINMKNELATLAERAELIKTGASDRLMTAEERTELKDNLAKQDVLREDIELRSGKQMAATPGRSPITAPTPKFKGFGDYAMAVRAAGMGDRGAHERLMAATTYNTEVTTTNDTGYAVIPDYKDAIDIYLRADDSFFNRIQKIPTQGYQVYVPVSNKTPEASYSGTGKGTWKAEGAALDQVKMDITQLAVTVEDFGAIINVSERALEDSTALGAYINVIAGEDLKHQLNVAILSGSGVSNQPKGVLAGAGLYKAPSGSQGKHVTFAHIKAMYMAMPQESRANAVWVANPGVETELWDLAMQFTSGSSSTSYPLYFPTGQGAVGTPPGTLLGRPIIYSAAAPVLGDVGDLSFVDFSKYWGATKTNYPKFESTPYLYWDQRLMSFRYVLRFGGTPRFASTLTRGGVTQSFYCAITAR